jgi:hypothetical protein
VGSPGPGGCLPRRAHCRMMGIRTRVLLILLNVRTLLLAFV